MYVHNTSNDCPRSLGHSRKTTIRYARGESVRNLPRLKKHLANCPDCNDLFLFVQKFTKGLGVQRAKLHAGKVTKAEIQRLNALADSLTHS